MDTKRRKTILALAVAIALAAPATAMAGDLRSTQRPVSGQYIVVLKREMVRVPGERSTRPDVVATAIDIASTYGVAVDLTYEHALQGFSVHADQKAIERLSDDPRVAWIEEDGVVTAWATQNGATWGIDRIDQRDLPLSSTYTYDTTASNVHAYIIDTGIRSSHNDFGGRVSGGFTAVSDGNGTNDCNGHGTHVSGTVGGATWGVAKGVQLHPVRVLSCSGNGTNSGVIAGIDWVTANHVKPAVANMSLGGGASSAVDTAVTNAVNAGVFIAVAAGNDNANACNYSPARAAAAVTVGSTTSTDARSSFSNFGTCLDIFGPGSSITSAWMSSDSATNTISGTSMASPHVAGVGALYLAANPNATPAQVTTAIVNNASTNKVASPGTGSPNRLLYSRFGGTPVDNPPVADFTSSCTGLSCTFNGSSSTDDNGITSYSWTFGDGGTGSGVNTSRTYGAAGTYNVTLTVTDTASQTNSRTRSVTVTTGGGAPCTGCDLYTGTIGTSGASQYQPNGSYYQAVAGVHRGYLRGPAGTDFDLYLQRWNGFGWSNVASGTSTSNNEDVTYNGTAGYYRWRIHAYSGTGSYNFWLDPP
ncbi:MAG TPA: S8 family serine peptidase [Xanthomonadales bacterium]|nr:S8 family serine peptidase [Xanthomonadales bacterium]